MSTPEPPPHGIQLAVYRRLVCLLPRPLVADHGDEMVALFADHLHATRGSTTSRATLWLRALGDLIRHGVALHRRFRRRPDPFPSRRPDMEERSLSSTLSNLRRDAVYALRLLRKDWSFTLTAVTILALAIGANTAIFSFVDTYLFRPLPYPEPDRLAIVTRAYDSGGQNTYQDGWTWEAIEALEDAPFSAAVYSSGAGSVNLATGDSALNVRQQRVSAGYFATLGVAPMMGREFTAAEDVPDGPPVTVLSHGLWRRLFNSDPAIVGETVTLKGEPYTVVGVMPEDFESSASAELWVPLRPSTSGEGGGTNYQILLRLDSGVGWTEGESTVAAAGQSMLEGDYPGQRFRELSIISLQDNDTLGLRDQLHVLWIAVGAVLLISCVNVSGLMMVRGNRRQREIATRLALGSGRTAITRQLLVESLVLAALAGIVGVLLAGAMMRGLGILGSGVLDTWRPVALDGRVLAVSAAAALLTALIFGLAPALQARRVSINDALRSGGRGSSGEGRWGRSLLVVAEVGLSVVLLVMAGLLLRTFLHFQTMDPGFDPERLATFSVSLQDARYETRDDVRQLFEEGIRRLETSPAVAGATAALGVPYERQLNMGFQPLDFEVAEGLGTVINVIYVSHDYFETLDIPILAGREIERIDGPDSEPVVVVNEAFQRRYFENGSALDHTIATINAERRIVGVAGNVKHAAGFAGFEPLDDVPTVYVSVSQLGDGFFPLVHTWFAPAWLVRFDGDPGEVVPRLERELASVDPLLPIAEVRLASEVQSQSIADQRFVAVLVASLALASVILAALGIWGLVASTVVEQRREIGIRMALGAGPRNAISVVATPSIRLAVVGAVLGVGGSVLAARTLTSMLWGVTPSDPLTYLAVAATLLVAATVASLIPAMRAARLDPARTLQAD